MDIQAYLHRIGYQGSLQPDLPTLAALQRAHMLTVPFENLDIHHNIPIYVDPDAQFEKIVRKKRGGFCHELNSLFRQLLEALGYETILVSAKSYHETWARFRQEFDHMAIIAQVGTELYLVDTCCEDFPFHPLTLDFQMDQLDARGTYRIRTMQNEFMQVSKVGEDGFDRPLYLFSHRPRKLREFSGMCKYLQTSDSSKFKQYRFCTLPTENGVKILKNSTFRVTYKRGDCEVELPNEAEVRALLKREFDIDLNWVRSNDEE